MEIPVEPRTEIILRTF